MQTLLQDVRYGLRVLRKSPAFTLIAILTLALGIGANTAIFSVVNTSLLRPLPFPHSSQLVDVWGHSTMFDFPNLGMSLPDIQDLRAQNTIFSALAPYNYSSVTLTGTGAPQALDCGKISADFFPLLGMKPLHGRNFSPAEMQPGQDREVILSDQLWQERFGADPHALGKSIMLDSNPYTIIGVMPPQQHIEFASDMKLWTPLAPTKEELAARGNHGTPAIARLKPGRTLAQAQTELDAIAARLAKTYPDDDKNWSFRAASLQTDLFGDARLPLLILLGAVGFVLLIACANVGNLFLSRGWTRRRELAVRSTLGATRSRLVRQLLVESLLVAFAGGILGLLLATWGVQALRDLLPPDTPRVQDLGIDQTVLWFTLGASIVAGILFGLAPAILSSRQELNTIIKDASAAGQSGAAGSRNRFFRQLLVVGEVALALVLVIGATLALRSFARLRSVNLGFHPDHVLTVNVTFPEGRFVKPEQFLPYVHQIVSLTRGISGVENAAASLYAPLSGFKGEASVSTQVVPEGVQSPSTEFNRSTPGYFQTLGIPLVAGRDFNSADTASSPRVYIVNQAFAQKFFGNASPIGKRIWSGRDAKKNPMWGEIVGEVANFHEQNAKDAPDPEFFTPYDDAKQSGGISLVVRSKTDPLVLVSTIRQRIWSIDSAQPLDNVKSMDQLVSESNAQPRFQTFLLALFGSLGLVLALVGIYGVISYTVTQRTHEIGIRMALGAEPAQVMRLILAHGLRLALIGVAIGVAASLGLTRLMSSLLFGVSATDPLTFAGVAILLTIIAVAACYIPARRAMRVDPMVALRYE
jgi:putative ABC transport system permease protein